MKAKKVTVEEVLADENFKHLSREEAEEYITSLEQFCVVLYEMYLSDLRLGLNENEAI